MRAIEAKTFSGYGGLRQIELGKPQPAKDKVLVRITAAGVTPLDHTILTGGHPRAKAPLVQQQFRRPPARHRYLTLNVNGLRRAIKNRAAP
jgi:NADPH:quinone reductase-like Zn-dependent oxidoreductase